MGPIEAGAVIEILSLEKSTSSNVVAWYLSSKSDSRTLALTRLCAARDAEKYCNSSLPPGLVKRCGTVLLNVYRNRTRGLSAARRKLMPKAKRFVSGKDAGEYFLPHSRWTDFTSRARRFRPPKPTLRSKSPPSDMEYGEVENRKRLSGRR